MNILPSYIVMGEMRLICKNDIRQVIYWNLPNKNVLENIIKQVHREFQKHKQKYKKKSTCTFIAQGEKTPGTM